MLGGISISSVGGDSAEITLTGKIEDGEFYSSLIQSPEISWSIENSNNFSVSNFQISLGTSFGARDLVDWKDIGVVSSYVITGLNLTNSQKYYPSIRIIDSSGKTSSVLFGDGWVVQSTQTIGPTIVFNDGTDTYESNKTPIFTWKVTSGDNSAISHFEIAIGSSRGTKNVLNWVNVGSVSSYQITGLTLTVGMTYYASIRAVDSNGNICIEEVQGDGWVINSELWTTNGAVNAIFQKGNILYLGGSFTEIAPWSGSGVPVNPQTGIVNWPDTQNKSRVTGTVMVAIPDSFGGFYIGGSFTKVGSLSRTNLAHLLSNGAVDPLFNPTTNQYVFSLGLSSDGNILYIGGSFTEVNGTIRNRVAAVNTSTGTLITGFNPNANGTVQTIALSPDGNTLFLGGAFTDLNSGTPRNRIAAVSTANGVTTAFDPNANDTVQTIALSPDGNTLFLGGAFTDLNLGTPRNRIAAVSTANGVTTAFNPDANETVYSIQLNSTGSILYMGGNFTTVGGTNQRNYVGAVTTSNGLVTAFNAQASWMVYKVTLSPDENTLYIAGMFTQANSINRNYVAAVNATTGVIVSNFDPNPEQWISAMSFNSTGNSLYLGGAFKKINSGTQRMHVGAIDTTTGIVVSGFNPNPNSMGVVLSIVTSPDGNLVYLGGAFTTLNGGTIRNRIAAVNASNGLLVNSFDPNANGTVSALSLNLDGSQLYLGGSFTTMNGGTTRNRVAAVNTVNGQLVTGFDPNANGTVSALSLNLDGSQLYLGGSFTTMNGGTTRNRVAAVNTVNGQLVTGFDPNANNTVKTLALSPDGSILYLGGSFTTMNGGTTRNRVAAVNTVNGQLVTGFDPDANNSVETMALSPDGSILYLGGRFSTLNGNIGRSYLGSVSTSNGIVNTGFNPGPSLWVYSLGLNSEGSVLYLGGTFMSLLNGGPNNFAPVNTSTGNWVP